MVPGFTTMEKFESTGLDWLEEAEVGDEEYCEEVDDEVVDEEVGDEVVGVWGE